MADTALGAIWFLLMPAARIGVYLFLVVIVFGRGQDFGHSPAIGITVGLTHFLLLSQPVTQSAGIIFSSGPLLLQAPVDPLLLVAAEFLRAVRMALIGVGISLALFAAFGPGLSPQIAVYPLLVIALLLVSWGASVIAAGVSVFVRDFVNLLPTLLQLLMYASPVIYATSFVPSSYLGFYFLNPVATLFALIQWSLFGGVCPPRAAIVGLATSAVLLVLVAHELFAAWRPRIAKNL